MTDDAQNATVIRDIHFTEEDNAELYVAIETALDLEEDEAESAVNEVYDWLTNNFLRKHGINLIDDCAAEEAEQDSE